MAKLMITSNLMFIYPNVAFKSPIKTIEPETKPIRVKYSFTSQCIPGLNKLGLITQRYCVRATSCDEDVQDDSFHLYRSKTTKM